MKDLRENRKVNKQEMWDTMKKISLWIQGLDEE